MKPNPVYHQFTVLYFPETGTWQVCDDMNDGVYDNESNERVSGEEFMEDHVEVDLEASATLNLLLDSVSPAKKISDLVSDLADSFTPDYGDLTDEVDSAIVVPSEKE